MLVCVPTESAKASSLVMRRCGSHTVTELVLPSRRCRSMPAAPAPRQHAGYRGQPARHEICLRLGLRLPASPENRLGIRASHPMSHSKRSHDLLLGQELRSCLPTDVCPTHPPCLKIPPTGPSPSLPLLSPASSPQGSAAQLSTVNTFSSRPQLQIVPKLSAALSDC